MVAGNQGGRSSREQRVRLEAQREREALRDFKRRERETEQDRRAQERAAKQAEREQAERNIQQRQAEAASLTRATEERILALGSVLTNRTDGGRVGFDALRRTHRPTAFTPSGAIAHPSPAPTWEQFEPPAPTGWGKLFKTAHAEHVTQARAEFAAAQTKHAKQEEARLAAVAAERAQHIRDQESEAQRVREHNAKVDELADLVHAGSPAEVERYFRSLLENPLEPNGIPFELDVAYQREPRRLLITRELPTYEIIPAEREFSYVRSRHEIDSKPRPDKEIRQRYADLVAQLTLRTMDHAFRIEADDIVDTVMISGLVSTRNKATGQPERPCLVSVEASREKFSGLVLDELDAAACLKHLSALVSQHPWELEPVRPIFEPDLSRYRIASNQDAVTGLDTRPVLIDMDPFEFERLIKKLFEAMGQESWVTEKSGDDGVDAVAVNPDPIMGGVCVIQAKRYRNTVPADAIRSLAGTMEDKRATRGILVTTSGMGPSAHSYAVRHGRIQIIEGPHLLHLLKEHLGMEALLGDVKAPRHR
jgi:restriction system protein